MSLATAFVTILMASTSHAFLGAQKPTYQGCYSSNQGLKHNDTNIYQSSGHCGDQCDAIGKVVMAMTGGNECLCGDAMPPLSSKVDDSKCSATCVGYPGDNCMFSILISFKTILTIEGGSPSGLTPVYYAVWNSGLVNIVTNAPASATESSGSSSTSANAAVVATVTGGE
jgi:cell wall integrity and stress response component